MISTGIKGIDKVITGLKSGDNVVWQIDDIKEYAMLSRAFVREALKSKREVIYFRFASHAELFKKTERLVRYELDPHAGFESFTTKVNSVITKHGEGAYYVFDCLTELLSAWAADLMVGNFFMVTCPYLFELKTFTYFAIMRNNHSFKSIADIRETTQLLIDVYRLDRTIYIHPLKVWNRYSPTMFLPHRQDGDDFVPVADSVDAAKILSYISRRGGDAAKRNLDYWDRLFLESEELAKSHASKVKIRHATKKLSSLIMTSNWKMLAMVEKHMTLDELVEVKTRLIGTGFIGGKSVGMLLARKILADRYHAWAKLQEPHDSFYIGSDIFYSYIVRNKLWKLRMQQKTPEGYYSAAKILKEKMLYGAFPEDVMEQFQQIIEHFGSSPIIIRSSSLLEDSFGNAFAGKYESVFLANQGSPEQRYIQFAEAVKRIYSSTMNEDALAYRKQRGLDMMDEQMALLVQRVSGSYHASMFFPDVAGVGVSYNTYVWNDRMRPESGMLRIVFGLGTRAVNRVEGDYPRMVALDEPMLRPYAQNDDLRKYSQHDVDVISIQDNSLKTVPFNDIAGSKGYKKADRVSIVDEEAVQMMAARTGTKKEYRILTLDSLCGDEELIGSFRKIMSILEKAYDYPVEIEFTLNFTGSGAYKLNLLQCRPLQTHGLGKKVDIPLSIPRSKLIFESRGYFLGGNISQQVLRVIFVDPVGYSRLELSDKHEVARIIGEVNRAACDRQNTPALLIGPGRWGTSTPSLGVPVKFAEINNVVSLVEVASTTENLMPELSFGTHFFQDLVETKIFYVALFPEKRDVIFNKDGFGKLENLLASIAPGQERFKNVIGLFDVGHCGMRIMSDVVSQKVVCFTE
jgi:hypothetical protein